MNQFLSLEIYVLTIHHNESYYQMDDIIFVNEQQSNYLNNLEDEKSHQDFQDLSLDKF